jgi:hypothetical protein
MIIVPPNYAFERSGHAPVLARACRAIHFASGAHSWRWLPAAERDRYAALTFVLSDNR